MKTKITETNQDVLLKQLADKRAELAAFRFDAGRTKIKNVKTGCATRRQIARILTKLTALRLEK